MFGIEYLLMVVVVIAKTNRASTGAEPKESLEKVVGLLNGGTVTGL